MASIVLKNAPQFDLDSFSLLLEKQLPSYASPIFLRIVETIGTTATYKHNKALYKKEGFDIHLIKDQIYFLDSNLKKYLPLDEKIFSRISSGDLKF